MSVWTINGVSTAALGASNLIRTLRVSNPAEFRFSLPLAVDADEAYPKGTPITLLKDGTPWFQGYALPPRRTGKSAGERHVVRAVNRWDDLDGHVYMQEWKYFNIAKQKARVVLGQDADGATLTTGMVIRQAVQYAIDSGANLQIGTIDAGLAIPLDEQVSITCGEVILRQLRWAIDQHAWIDDTTIPPTFHCRKRDNLVEVALAINDVDMDLSERWDTQVPAVAIQYELAGAPDSVPLLTEDIYPAGATGAEKGAVVICAELSGSTQVTPHIEDIVTKDLPTNFANDNPVMVAWWKSIFPELSKVQDLHITDCAYNCTKTYPRALKSGRLHSWLKVRFNVKAETDCSLTATASWKRYNPLNGMIEQEFIVPLQISFTATTAETKVYNGSAVVAGTEAAPEGLAKYMYDALHALQYDGSIFLAEDEVSGIAVPGRVLNITGGKAAWATMRAPIVETVEDIDRGVTTVRIGPARHLGYDDLVEQLKCNRVRQPSHSWLQRTDNAAQASRVESSGPDGDLMPTALPGKVVLRFHA